MSHLIHLFALFARGLTALVLCFSLAAAALAQTPHTEATTGPAVLSSLVAPVAGPNAAPNPYGWQALWAQGDGVTQSTLLLLALMSLCSWYVLLSKLLRQWRLGRQERAVRRLFWQADTVQDGAQKLPAGSAYRFIADTALQAVHKHPSLKVQVDLNTWLIQGLERAVAEVQAHAQDGLAVLATVGSTAPFVGLFGTVWGIYNALIRIGASGQASIDRVAGPVGEALVMTAFGLAVAVPAVLGYNWLVRRNRVALDRLRAFASDVHAALLTTPQGD